MPVPKNKKISEDKDQQDINLKKLIDKDSLEIETEKTADTDVQNLENSILKKINKN